MATWTVTGRSSLLSVIAHHTGRLLTSVKSARPLLLGVLTVVARLLLTVAGLGCIVTAAYLVAIPLGWCAAGVSLLLLEWVVKR